MADASARSLQYEYKANSNLVLQADTRLIERRARDEATGEVFSLEGKLSGTRMGDRYERSKPTKDATEKKRKVKKKDSSGSKMKTVQSVLQDSDELAGIEYRPKTDETKQTYEVLLSFLQDMLGDNPRDLLCGAADEVLRTLKTDRIKETERRKELEMLLGTFADERYAVLVNLCKKITDYSDNSGDVSEQQEIDDTYGVNVEFDRSDDEESGEEMVDMVVEGASDDDEGPEDGYEAKTSTLQANLESKGPKHASSETKGKLFQTRNP